MNQIPTLYELCCRAYKGDVQFQGYEEAFDAAMAEVPKPNLILHRVQSKQPMVPFNRVYDDDTVVQWQIPNPFIWRVAYVDERRFIEGPRYRPRFRQMEHVVVLEEKWKDEFGGMLVHKTHIPVTTVPIWYRRLQLQPDIGEFLYPTMSYPNPDPRKLYPQEIMTELRRLFTPKYSLDSIKGTWFADAELSVALVDGVPESTLHSEKRGRRMQRVGSFIGWWGQPVDGRDSWQHNNEWKQGLSDPRV